MLPSVEVIGLVTVATAFTGFADQRPLHRSIIILS
jgi:hypothetical protein